MQLFPRRRNNARCFRAFELLLCDLVQMRLRMSPQVGDLEHRYTTRVGALRSRKACLIAQDAPNPSGLARQPSKVRISLHAGGCPKTIRAGQELTLPTAFSAALFPVGMVVVELVWLNREESFDMRSPGPPSASRYQHHGRPGCQPGLRKQAASLMQRGSPPAPLPLEPPIRRTWCWRGCLKWMVVVFGNGDGGDDW